MSRFDQLSVGDVVTGTVVSTVPFGSFVRIADDADGLLYGVTDVAVDSAVAVRILEIDTAKKRASLALA